MSEQDKRMADVIKHIDLIIAQNGYEAINNPDQFKGWIEEMLNTQAYYWAELKALMSKKGE